MKKSVYLLFCLCLLAFSLTGCGAAEEKTELTVFAAASMTETLTEIGNAYMAENEDVSIVFNFDSSGTLKTQIEEGADCDIFVSASPKQMNQLDATAGGMDCVLAGTRFDMLENKVVLAVPEDNPAGIHSYEDLKAGLENGTVLLAMGNADVPVGQYTQKILQFFGLAEEELVSAGVITYGSNAKEVTLQVAEGAVDCGILYATDAHAAGLAVVDFATADMCGRVIYPAAVLNTTKNPDAAKAFTAYLQKDAAGAVFERAGFTVVEK